MLYVLFASFLTGVGGASLGGVLGVLLGAKERVRRALYALTAGIMLSIVCFELVPESLETLNVLFFSIVAISGGILIFVLEKVTGKFVKDGRKSFSVALAIALHNFPEGMIIGSGFAIQKALSVSLLVALHDIPEGIAASLPYVNKSKFKGILAGFLSGIPTVLGAVLGYLFSGFSDISCAITLAFSAGAMLYVVFSQIIPCSIDLKRNDFSGIIVIIGIIIGLVFISLV
ncbi:MAG: ZIP family metal transporter [Clostridia bacterium]|nr:ZIP family metal transporter [Clostridia bacterium]